MGLPFWKFSGKNHEKGHQIHFLPWASEPLSMPLKVTGYLMYKVSSKNPIKGQWGKCDVLCIWAYKIALSLLTTWNHTNCAHILFPSSRHRRLKPLYVHLKFWQKNCNKFGQEIPLLCLIFHDDYKIKQKHTQYYIVFVTIHPWQLTEMKHYITRSH